MAGCAAAIIPAVSLISVLDTLGTGLVRHGNVWIMGKQDAVICGAERGMDIPHTLMSFKNRQGFPAVKPGQVSKRRWIWPGSNRCMMGNELAT